MPAQGFGESKTAPTGTIVMWADLLSDIPSGWVICDGNNGTPNLLGHFIKSTTGSGDIGATGGQNSVSLSSGQLPSHQHSGNTSNDGSHRHMVLTPEDASPGNSNANKRLYNDAGNSSYTSKNIQTGGSHNHSTNTSNSGSGSSIDNRPPFYEVAFIMKT